MGIIVVLRHAKKEYGNRCGHIVKYDSPIVQDEWGRAKVVFSKHISEHALTPTRIICSPYRRTRETAEILQEMTENKLDVEVNREFSNFLGWNKESNDSDFEEETRNYTPYQPEKLLEFHKRVNRAFQKVYDELGENDIVWIITHRFIINSHLQARKLKTKRFRALEGVIFKEGNIETL